MLLRPFVRVGVDLAAIASPTHHPRAGQLLPIGEIYNRLQALVGQDFSDTGYDQERNRGATLHRLVCQHLGYTNYQDDGQFPDVRHQLLEVKLQTSPTIDLGLVRPDSEEALGVPNIEGRQIRHCDVRYALFYAVTDGQNVTLTHLFLTTGEKFFVRFRQISSKINCRWAAVPIFPLTQTADVFSVTNTLVDSDSATSTKSLPNHGVQFLLKLLGFGGRRAIIYLLRLGNDVLPN